MQATLRDQCHSELQGVISTLEVSCVPLRYCEELLIPPLFLCCTDQHTEKSRKQDVLRRDALLICRETTQNGNAVSSRPWRPTQHPPHHSLPTTMEVFGTSVTVQKLFLARLMLGQDKTAQLAIHSSTPTRKGNTKMFSGLESRDPLQARRLFPHAEKPLDFFSWK